jgi:iron(III) transport system permease protein
MLLSVSLTCFLLQKLWIGRKSYVTVTGKGSGGEVMPLPRLLERSCGVVVFGWIVFNTVLYSSIFVGGFVVMWGADYTPTLQYYDELWGQGLRSGGWPSYINTIVLATIAAPLTTFMGILIAYVTTRRSFRGRGIIDFGSMISFAIPGTVIGVSYILAFNTPPVEITGTALILIICFIFRNMPVGIRAGISALSQIDQSLEEASLTQRAGTFRTIFSVVLPLLRPAIMSASVYSFIRSITSVSAVIFLVTAETDVGTTYILAQVEDGNYGISVAYGTVLIMTMLAATILINLMVGKSRVERQMVLE